MPKTYHNATPAERKLPDQNKVMQNPKFDRHAAKDIKYDGRR